MRNRIQNTLELLPWLVAEDERGTVSGYVYAGRHRDRKVGFKHGAWRDVGWWQRPLQEPSDPVEPKAFRGA